jgi:hypothetical protein
MKTLMGLVVFSTIFYWLWMWDKALKTRTKTMDHFPQEERSRMVFLIANLISAIILVGLILVYLP